MSQITSQSKGHDPAEVAWPKEIKDDYDPIRPLGRGAFGLVWLAKLKRSDDCQSSPKKANIGERRISKSERTEDDDSADSIEREDTIDDSTAAKSSSSISNPHFVAIKQIQATDPSKINYASREIDILSEISHPNITKCISSTELPQSRLVVMTLADGPDLGKLISCGGALGKSLARLASRHLIAAVSYLHKRGVIHRDIKPENCVLTKADSSNYSPTANADWVTNDSFWSDRAVFDEKEWKVVLVDFGFARPLNAEEVGNHKSVRNLFQSLAKKQASTRNSLRSSKSITKSSTRSRSSSFQRVPIRALSALGTRGFAAPEVRDKARDKSTNDDALAESVSDYGLIADAYSVGSTIKVFLTGVPANVTDVMGFISANDNIVVNIISAIFSCGKKDGNKRKKRYKFMDETPKPARELIAKLMQPNVEDRITVQSSRNEPWVKGGLGDDDPVYEYPEGDIPVGEDDSIVLLKCANKY